MGLIRQFFLVVVCVLLLISFILQSIFLTISLSLEYETLKPELTAFTKTLTKESLEFYEYIESRYPQMQEYCNHSEDFVFYFSERTFSTPCEIIDQGVQGILDYNIEEWVKEIYYSSYECNFWDCFKKTGEPFFLFSNHSREYWDSKFFNFLIASVILFILLFLLAESKANFFFITGIISMISALILIRIDWLLEKILVLFFSGAANLFSFNTKHIVDFFFIFFSKSSFVFFILFVFALILIAIGIVFKMVGIGLKISSFLNKFSRKEKVVEKTVVEKAKQEIIPEKKQAIKEEKQPLEPEKTENLEEKVQDNKEEKQPPEPEKKQDNKDNKEKKKKTSKKSKK